MTNLRQYFGKVVTS